MYLHWWQSIKDSETCTGFNGAPSPVINLNYADMAPNMIKNAIEKLGAVNFAVS